MKSPAKKAMDDLKEYMVQMRHDAVEGIQDGLRTCIESCVDRICEEYDVIDKQTRKPVELKGFDLTETIRDSEWYQHGIIELLIRNEDDALEQMTWIAKLEDAAPTDETTTDLPRNTTLPTYPPVGRDQYIQGIEQLRNATLTQQTILHKAFQCLQMIPDVVNYGTAAHEAHDIAMLKQFMHTQWVAEMRKAHHMYTLLMRGHGRGMGDQAAGALEQ
ncbi:uncharacterized protein EKO05_0011450 [Ascochyta rabiei]|uniref:Uncharacterized protein n=1 Tax=Didymella rabiei TaxID=5454 RepID=A0A163ERG6_DIDRA|nr:uncharacterized protein EKO05_0011450 [Ascochyta rabiei]KZM23865.1 hypothetical protein ST47_g4972 [Ascochyta rabiei]UPX21258.1 hypothetical protein EKO05_0011450 [Ascochyta rabiei]